MLILYRSSVRACLRAQAPRPRAAPLRVARSVLRLKERHGIKANATLIGSAQGNIRCHRCRRTLVCWPSAGPVIVEHGKCWSTHARVLDSSRAEWWCFCGRHFTRMAVVSVGVDECLNKTSQALCVLVDPSQTRKRWDVVLQHITPAVIDPRHSPSVALYTCKSMPQPMRLCRPSASRPASRTSDSDYQAWQGNSLIRIVWAYWISHRGPPRITSGNYSFRHWNWGGLRAGRRAQHLSCLPPYKLILKSISNTSLSLGRHCSSRRALSLSTSTCTARPHETATETVSEAVKDIRGLRDYSWSLSDHKYRQSRSSGDLHAIKCCLSLSVDNHQSLTFSSPLPSDLRTTKDSRHRWSDS